MDEKTAIAIGRMINDFVESMRASVQAAVDYMKRPDIMRLCKWVLNQERPRRHVTRRKFIVREEKRRKRLRGHQGLRI